MEILGIKGSKVEEDGKHLHLTLETDRGPLLIDGNYLTLEGVLSQLVETLLEARRMRGPRGLAAIQVPSRTHAAATDNLDAVVLRLEMPTGLSPEYGLHPQQAEDLAAELQRFAALCRNAKP